MRVSCSTTLFDQHRLYELSERPALKELLS